MFMDDLVMMSALYYFYSAPIPLHQVTPSEITNNSTGKLLEMKTVTAQYTTDHSGDKSNNVWIGDDKFGDEKDNCEIEQENNEAV